MKRYLSLLLALVMLFSLVSCSSSSLAGETAGETSTLAETTDKKEENKEIVYPEGFSVGYARADITPTESVPIYEVKSNGVRDPLYLTCTAVCDGENVGLLMSADLKSFNRKITNQSAKIIEKEFGIPLSNIIISATHTHSAPDVVSNDEAVIRWSALFYKQLKVVVRDALLDLAPAEAYAGVSHTEGLTFVRRYKLENGKYQTNPYSSASKPVEHESEADNELRTIRFDRGDKKDILMVNYQTHYGYYTEQISSDFVGLFRDQAEEKWDSHFVYYSGAGGNLNFDSLIPGERKYSGVPEGMVELMNVTQEALDGEEKVSTGDKVVAYHSDYAATVYKDSPEKVAQAKEVSQYEEGSAKYTELVSKYGLGSKRWISAIITRAGLGDTQNILFHAVAFGDIAFTSAPYEQFDQNAKDVREASPFKMTFTLSLANGSNSYVPTKLGFEHGGYEAAMCRFVPGCGEEFANEQIRLLNLCKNAD